MTQSLDPYHEWLGIPPEDQPPHHYRLLGIALFEPDDGLIREAADSQARLVREMVSSDTMAPCRRVVNHIGKAERTLLDPDLRLEYDQKLRTSLGLDSPPPPPPPARPDLPTVVSSDVLSEGAPPRHNLPDPNRLVASRTPRRRRVQFDWRFPVLVGAVAALVIGGIFVAKELNRTDRSTAEGTLSDVSDEIQELTTSDQKPGKEPAAPLARGESGGKSDRGKPENRESTPSDETPQPKLALKPVPEVLADPSPKPDDLASPPASDPPSEPAAKSDPEEMPEDKDPHAQRKGGNDAEVRPEAPTPPVKLAPVKAPPADGTPVPPEVPEPVAPAVPAEDRSVPTKELLREARKKIKDEFSPWPTDRKERIKLATKLIQLSEDRSQSRARQYALLDQARLIATRSGSLSVAWQSLNQLCDRFDVDRIRLQTSLLIPFAKKALADDFSRKMLAANLLQVLDDAIHADRFDIAHDVHGTIGILAERWQDGDLSKVWTRHVDLVRAGKKHFKRITQAKKILKDDPKDPVANRTLGEFYAYATNNWSRGAVHLRQCDDDALKKAATFEIDILGGDDTKTAAGKAWLEVASKIKGKNIDAKLAAQMRARYWLIESWRESEGEARATVETVMTDEGILLVNSVGMRLMRIPAGRFVMGSPKTEEGREKSKVPIENKESRIVETEHLVTLTNDFFIGMHEVTQAQFHAVMGKNPSVSGKEGRRPVENVSWPLASTFCKRLGTMGKGTRYRLPTEAEWEYACRAGTRTRFHFGETITKDHAAIQLTKPMKVGNFAPNAFGLFDMHGNVAEWVLDRFQPGFYRPATNPVAVRGLTLKVPHRFIRGGGFVSKGFDLRSASRKLAAAEKGHKWIGFRVVLESR